MERLKNRIIYCYKSHRKLIVFHFILNIVFALFITASSYYHVPLNTTEAKGMYFIHLCVLQSTFVGILYLISFNIF